MEFDLDIQHGWQGHIEVTDYSKEYGQYYAEDTQGITSTEMYKYSQSASLNIIVKVETDKADLMDILLDEHKEDKETVYFDVTRDGYYILTHFVLPNESWFNEQTTSPNSLLENYSQIYYIKNKKVYKRTITIENKTSTIKDIIVGEETEVSARELLERNIEGTTIKKCKVDIFYTGFLQECYINYCKALFKKLMEHCRPNCRPKETSDEQFARDFLWMTLNVIDYLVQYKQFMEAQRILEEINYCGGFCNIPNEFKSECGCSSHHSSCGCGSH